MTSFGKPLLILWVKLSAPSTCCTMNLNLCYFLLNSLPSSLDYKLHEKWEFVHFVLIPSTWLSARFIGNAELIFTEGKMLYGVRETF